MQRHFLVVVTCFLVMSLAWADEKEDAAKKELEKMQGEWKLSVQDDVTLKIKGNEYEFTAGNISEKGKFKFNPSTKPAQVDVDITEGNDAGKKQVGIYELKEDKVKFCFAKAGEVKRPDKFESSEDGSLILFEFEKVKK